MRFLEVGCHHVRLDPDRAADQLLQHRSGWIQRGGRVILNQLEDHRIGDEARLDHLRHPGDELVSRQRLQRCEIRQDSGGFMERADQVLACIGVDAGLAAYRSVDHAQQRGRHVHHSDAAQPVGGHEAGEVSHRSAAEAHKGAGAVQSHLSQHVPAKSRHR